MRERERESGVGVSDSSEFLPKTPHFILFTVLKTSVQKIHKLNN